MKLQVTLTSVLCSTVWVVLSACSHTAVPKTLDSADALPTTVIQHVQIVGSDADSRTATVTIERDRIVNVTAVEQAPPGGARLIDGSQLWLVPGLIDGHVHLAQSGSAFTRPDMIGATKIHSYSADQAWLAQALPGLLRDYLRLGITTVADLGGPSAHLQALQQLDCSSLCPQILSAAELLSAAPVPELSNGDDTTFVVANDSQAAQAIVSKQFDRGARISKFVWTNEAGLTPAQLHQRFAAAMQAAKQQGQIVAVHAQDLDYAKAAMRAGADILVHGVMNAPIDAEFIALAKTHQVTYMPTLTAYQHYLDIYQQKLTFTEYEQQLADDYVIDSFAQLNANITATAPMFQLLTRYLPMVDAAAEARAALTAQEQAIVAQLAQVFSQRILQLQYRNLRAALDAGLLVGFGTDAGNPGTMHALAVAEEIHAWQRAGARPDEILYAMTAGNARAYQLAQQQGAIEPGKLATFSLLSEDPLLNPQSLLAPAYVFKNGTIVHNRESQQ